MEKMPHILWLASWYPNRTDEFHGDFIERHAQAVSSCVKLTVMVVVKDENLDSDAMEVERSGSGNLVVYRVYYGRGSVGGVFEKIRSSLRYFRLQKNIYRQVVTNEGSPGLVHVQVAMKAGMLALWIKQQFNIPYVVTEHWTGYYPGAVPNIYRRNFIFRFLTKKVLEKASLLLPVTEDLGRVILSHLVSLPVEVIPNVVDTTLFNYTGHTPSLFRFLHVSSLGFQKNAEGIIRACRILKDQGKNFELVIIGNQAPELEALAATLELKSLVHFQYIVPYEEIARQMKLASAFVLFSRFENLPCVILEALCSGLPVISSRVGGIAEVINHKNGLLVQSGDENDLAASMGKMMQDYDSYDRQDISDDAVARFNYKKVAQQHFDIYHRFLTVKPATI